MRFADVSRAMRGSVPDDDYAASRFVEFDPRPRLPGLSREWRRVDAAVPE
jgi:hypothetical protein